jgi:drug/metabolite transporter (DMT)-like permease
MEPIALALVLAAAGVHAGWNRLLHDTGDRIVTIALAGLLSGLLLLPAVIVQPPARVLPLVILSALIEAIYAVCLAVAYRHGDLSLAYPIGRGVSPLLVTLGAWILLGQGLSPETAVGAAALGLGLTVVAWQGHASSRRTAIIFAILTGAGIAAYSLVDAQAVRQTGPAGYLGAVLALQGIALAICVRPDRERWRAAFRPAALISIGSVAAYLLVLLAFQRASPGRVATLREVSVLLGLVLARERPGKLVWLGGALVVAGAALVAA